MPEPLLDVFRARFGPLEEQFLSTEPGDTFSGCFGCGPGHPSGLRVRTFKTDEGVLAPIVVPSHYEGPRGATHGGIVTAYLDEVLAGAAVRATGRLSVTGEISVRFVKPVPLETPLIGRGRLTARHERYVDVEGSIEALESSEVLARARARFFFQDRRARAAPPVPAP